MIEKTRFVNTLIRNQNQLEHPPQGKLLELALRTRSQWWKCQWLLVTYCPFNKKYTVLPIHFQRNLQIC
jgi:hypothetical protein